MAKDPAIMFYTQDFLTGVMFFSDAQTGIYIKLLCAQHQHGGIIPKDYFIAASKNDEQIKQKFIEVEEGFFNKRLMEEMEKRSNKSSNLSNNAKKRWEKYRIAMQMQSKSNAIASDLHMPIEDEDEDENISSSLNLNSNVSNINNVNNICEAGNLAPGKQSKKPKKPKAEKIVIPVEIPEALKAAFADFIEFRKKKGSPLTERAKELTIEKLEKLYPGNPDMQNKSLLQSVECGWTGVYPVKAYNQGTFSKNGSQGFKMRNDNFLDIPEA